MIAGGSVARAAEPRVQGTQDVRDGPRARRGRARAALAAGLAGLALAELARRRGLEPFASAYFVLTWWSYVLAADAFVHLKVGRSLLLSRPRAALALAGYSAAFWTAFELVNLRLANWYYVGVPPGWTSRWLGAALAFATVLPGILVTAELCGALLPLDRLRARPWRPGPRARTVMVALGALSLALALGFPRACFALVWGAVVLLGEPWLARRRARGGLLDALGRGELGPLARLLAAGIVCGLLWELWNFGAPAKWIYTVPFLEDAKLFEMPLLGFLGFPPFALECYTFARVLVESGAAPEWDPARPARRAAARPAALAAALSVAVLALGIWAVNARTVRGTQPFVGDLRELDDGARAALETQGVTTVARLLVLWDGGRLPDALAERFARDPAQAARVRDEARLLRTAWMGTRGAAWLAAVGVHGPDALAREDPLALHARLARAAGPSPRPSAAEVRVWVRAARRDAR